VKELAGIILDVRGYQVLLHSSKQLLEQLLLRLLLISAAAYLGSLALG
jgi:hypothetical protein